MTDLERVRDNHMAFSGPEVRAIIDAHEKEDAERDAENARRGKALYDATNELTELREELRLVKHNYEALARHVRAGRQLIKEKP